MITNETIAHDLAIIYLSNRYGTKITGDFRINDGNSMGDIRSQHFPDADTPKYTVIGTGEKGFLGIEKKVKAENGYVVDDLFIEILKNYQVAYKHFLSLLENG